jgi:hypothetical protein
LVVSWAALWGVGWLEAIFGVGSDGNDVVIHGIIAIGYGPSGQMAIGTPLPSGRGAQGERSVRMIDLKVGIASDVKVSPCGFSVIWLRYDNKKMSDLVPGELVRLRSQREMLSS